MYARVLDALAAYLYLLNPPKDAGFEPLNPKNIVIAAILDDECADCVPNLKEGDDERLRDEAIYYTHI
ncbi:hypothetical protein RhiirA4_481341 [Rhizophagus irregularis]|uniref:Uncharacterized protein n=1 Tax=Rhizophagus irregularis TaxID=588596 RepID=A0A2I1HJE1_9GLOM|nr:hypothetical protein RhiirA4_481341 [Rhizophagus irregularis]